MILRTGNKTHVINPRNKLTHADFQRVVQLASLEAQLADVQQLVLQESAKGPSLKLRRLREKASRLESRIENTRLLTV